MNLQPFMNNVYESTKFQFDISQNSYRLYDNFTGAWHGGGIWDSVTKMRKKLYSLPFFLSSGFPFLTVANTMSPHPDAGSLLRRPLIPFTAMMYRFLAPVLSAQFITAPTGKPSEIRNFPPEEPPRPANGNPKNCKQRSSSYQVAFCLTNAHSFEVNVCAKC